jgi:hypothetical protein
VVTTTSLLSFFFVTKNGIVVTSGARKGVIYAIKIRSKKMMIEYVLTPEQQVAS